MTRRPDFIKHWSEIQEPDNSHYAGDSELMSLGSPLGKATGLTRIGIHHEVLKPGRRTSWPHAEKHEEEFAYVIEGTPDVWINGELFRLNPGDGVGFASGTGITHTFINNTEADVRMIVVGEKSKKGNQVFYALHPKRNIDIKEALWTDPPPQKMGFHDGMSDLWREFISYEPFNLLHDGVLDEIHGMVPGSLELVITCNYMRERFEAPGETFLLRLEGCSRFAYQSYEPDASAIMNLSQIAKLELEILSAEKEGDIVQIFTGDGEIHCAYSRCSVWLNESTELSFGSLSVEFDKHWSEFQTAKT